MPLEPISLDEFDLLYAEAKQKQIEDALRAKTPALNSSDPDGLLVPLPTRYPPPRVVPPFPLAAYATFLTSNPYAAYPMHD